MGVVLAEITGRGASFLCPDDDVLLLLSKIVYAYNQILTSNV